MVRQNGKVHPSVGFLFFFFWGGGTITRSLVIWPRLVDPFVSQNPREVHASHFPEGIPGCSYIIIISIIVTPWEFSTSANADGLSQKFKWQQVPSSLPNSYQYSGQSQQRCSLDGLQLSSYFQVHQSMYQSFIHCTRGTNYNWYHRHFYVPQFFRFSWKVSELISLFAFFQFYSVVSQDIIIIIIIMSSRQEGYTWPSLATSPYRSSPQAGLQCYIPYPHIAAVCMFEQDNKFHNSASPLFLFLFFFFWLSLDVVVWARLGDPFVSQNPREVRTSQYPENILDRAYIIIIVIYSLRVCPINLSWWSFSGVWVTASLFKSPELFSVFSLFSIML